MWSGVFGEGESRFKVLSEKFSLFKSGDDGRVDGSLGLLLLGKSVLFSLGFLLSWGSEESFLGLLNSLCLYSLEVVVVDLFSLDSADVNLGGGWDDSALVDSSEWDSVKLEWSSNQKEARLELSKEDDSLSLESTDQEDQNSSWSDVSSKSDGLWGFGWVSSDSSFTFSWVP